MRGLLAPLLCVATSAKRLDIADHVQAAFTQRKNVINTQFVGSPAVDTAIIVLSQYCRPFFFGKNAFHSKTTGTGVFV